MSGDLYACARIVERGDPDRFAAVMAAPVPARRSLWPVYAFNVEVSRAPWVTKEPLIARMRLQWWSDVLDEIAAGGPVRRHEVATPLAEVMPRWGADLLRPVVEARHWDVEERGFADEAALWAHLGATAGALLRGAAVALGAQDGEGLKLAGRAQGMALWLAAVHALEAVGKHPLPDGRPEAVVRLAQGGLAALEEARHAGVPEAAGPAMIALSETGALLRRAASSPDRVASQTLVRGPAAVAARRAWVALTGRW